MAQQPDRRVGSYTLSKQLGRGSFAEVWLGRHTATGAVVAIKEINTSFLNAKLCQALAGEVSIMQRVVHRNIVRLHETLEVTCRSNCPVRTFGYIISLKTLS